MCAQSSARRPGLTHPPLPIFPIYFEGHLLYIQKTGPQLLAPLHYSYGSCVLVRFIFNNEAGTWNIHKLGLRSNETREWGKRPVFNLSHVEFLKACILHISPRQDFNQCEMVLRYWLGPGWRRAAVIERQWEVTLLADRMRFENVLCCGVWGVRGIARIFRHFTLFVEQPEKTFHWRVQMSGI